MGYDHFMLRLPVFGNLIEKNILARTTRTLGRWYPAVFRFGSPQHHQETAGNALFEKIYAKVIEAIREGDVISKPMAAHSSPGFHRWPFSIGCSWEHSQARWSCRLP